MSYESKIGPKVTPNPTRTRDCMGNCGDTCIGGCGNSCSGTCYGICEVGGGHTRIVPEGEVK